MSFMIELTLAQDNERLRADNERLKAKLADANLDLERDALARDNDNLKAEIDRMKGDALYFNKRISQQEIVNHGLRITLAETRKQLDEAREEIERMKRNHLGKIPKKAIEAVAWWFCPHAHGRPQTGYCKAICGTCLHKASCALTAARAALNETEKA